MSDWEDTNLGSVVSTNQTSVDKSYPHKTINYLDTGSITEGVISEFQAIEFDGAPSRAKRLVKPFDIVYSTVRPIQRHYGIIKEPLENLVVSTGFAVIEVNKEKADPNFIYHFLSSEMIVEELDMIAEASTSAYPSMKPTDIEKIEIQLPPLPEQKAIAGVLSSLDDKIDLLHRQNKTLEALAETLFRQWFIEEAKDDWDKCRLGELVQFKYGKALKKSLRSGIGYPVVGSGGVVDFHTEALVKGVGIVTGRKGTLGDQHYFWDGFFPIDTTFYIVPKRQTKNMLFEYFLLRTINFKRMNSDSAVPGLNREIAESAEINNPPSSLKVEFDEGVGPLFDKIRFNNLQIKTLENIRDLLLPKLMNGEVRVSYEGSHA